MSDNEDNSTCDNALNRNHRNSEKRQRHDPFFHRQRNNNEEKEIRRRSRSPHSLKSRSSYNSRHQQHRHYEHQRTEECGNRFRQQSYNRRCDDESENTGDERSGSGYRGDRRSNRDLGNFYRRRYERDDNNEESNQRNNRPSWENSKVRRHAEEIQQRKLLWSSSSSAKIKDTNGFEGSATTSGPSMVRGVSDVTLESAWTSRLAAATNDFKQMDKFQRLMGIKKSSVNGVGDTNLLANNTSEECASGSKLDDSYLARERQRQAELTAQLDRQYTMARATTHMGRGKGLGFGG